MKKFMINLKRRQDRKNNMISLFREKNVKIEIFEGTDGNELTGNNYLFQLFQNNNFNYRKGVIGCALSHYNLWKKLVDDDVEYYCIFEDDITLTENFDYKLQKCYEFLVKKRNTDMLLLGYSMFKNNIKTHSYLLNEFPLSFEPFNLNLFIGGFFGYIISKSGANKMIEYIQKNGIHGAIDCLIKLNTKMNIYQCNPFIVKTDWVDVGNFTIDSDIQRDYNILSFKAEDKYVTKYVNKNKYKFYKNLDSIGSDLKYISGLSIEQLSEIVEKEENCIGFNSLGYLKCEINNIISLDKIDLYVKF